MLGAFQKLILLVCRSSLETRESNFRLSEASLHRYGGSAVILRAFFVPVIDLWLHSRALPPSPWLLPSELRISGRLT